uniref:ABC transporter domain-containing protein n=1 Tax=Alexandrium monilatum TaxID=311494 RepID=A0A7S4WH88_9DINO
MAVQSKAISKEDTEYHGKGQVAGAMSPVCRQPTAARSVSCFTEARTWVDRLCPAEWQRLRSFWRVLAPYWLNPSTRREAFLRALAIIGLTFGNTVAMLNGTMINGIFLKAVADKSRRGFYRALGLHLLNVAWSVPCLVFQQYFQAQLAVKWREWMTSKFFDRYFQSRKYYEIQAEGKLDNPDQRINDDIRSCTTQALATSQMVLGAALDFGIFSAILLKMYPPMFVALVAMATAGTRISLWLGRRLIALNCMQEQHEADFRFGLVRLRENAESIAFYKGEEGERDLLFRRLYAVMKNTEVSQVVSRNLGYFTHTYTHLVRFIPYWVAVPHHFRGGIDFAFVNQCAEVFNHITGDASLVISQLEGLANFYTTVERLDEFLDVLEAKPAAGGIRRSTAEAPTLLGVEGLSVKTPDKRTLFSGLDFKLRSGESLLVMGPSGCGKTSLMRVVAGLWSAGEGTVSCNLGAAGASHLFMPQRPYMVLGSLREQMLYPTWATGRSCPDRLPAPEEAQLVAALEAVRLAHLLRREGGLEAVADWAAVLSLGEQQRLGITRVLLARPVLALLDECTSALDADCEARIYSLLKASGTAYVSVSHHTSLKGFHGKLLQFSPGASDEACSWALSDSGGSP